MTTPLSDHAAIKISGLDAKKFLQGQLTCDVEKITPQQGNLAAHCNPQGRIISLFYLSQWQDAYVLVMPKNLLPIALLALKKYAIFYKVELTEITPNFACVGWRQFNIAQKIPTIYAETSGKLLPHDINLQQLDAISFNKGCYTGQEIITRMHYRAKLKNHLYHAKNLSGLLPLPGANIYAMGGQIVGIVIDADQETILFVTDEAHAKEDVLTLDHQTTVFLTEIY